MRDLLTMILTLLLSTDDILEEVDGNLLVIWEIDATFHGAELVALSFCTVLG